MDSQEIELRVDLLLAETFSSVVLIIITFGRM